MITASLAPEERGTPTWMQKGAILLLVTFLLIFPKGGFKIAGIPVTWGYLGLAFFTLPFLFGLMSGRGGAVARVRFVVLALLVPFQLVLAFALLLNGTGTIGFSVSLLVTFFFLPLAFVLLLGFYLEHTDLEFVFRLVRFGVLAVAVYGIVLFVYKLQTGSFIEIPYLTVNAGDVGGLEDKYIDRGGVFKLISTYNNGNIYGVSILLLLPLYALLEQSSLKVSIVRLSLLLTLSRTVWVGLVLFEILQRLYVRRVTFRTVSILLVSLFVVALGVWYALDLMGLSLAFLFDRRLGGRIGQLQALETATLVPREEFLGIAEIVYLSILHNFGLLGLACFLVGMAAPLLLHSVGCLPLARTAYKKSLASGLLIYLIIAASDGAILYIPVMAIYWFVVSLLLSSNGPPPPSKSGVHARSPRLRLTADSPPSDMVPA